MGRPPIGKRAMTPAERQRRRRRNLAKPSIVKKQIRRAEREAALAGKQIALPDRRFGVILADPEWRFEPWSRETGMDRAADNHYPTSPLGARRALDRRR